MNRYPLWKYITLLVVLLLGLLYAVPNFFGEAPAVQISAIKASQPLDTQTLTLVQKTLEATNLTADGIGLEGGSIRVRLNNTETQIKARDALDAALNPKKDQPHHVVALNMVPRAPAWMLNMGAKPMYLGLDLRGGVHFMLQLNLNAAIERRLDTFASDMRRTLKEKGIRRSTIQRRAEGLDVKILDETHLKEVLNVVQNQFSDLKPPNPIPNITEGILTLSLSEPAVKTIKEQAIKQNITTLHNRINELGVAEPVIQQQGLDRIVVQLPGVQDTAKAKDILGRTATLQVRLVDESGEARVAERSGGPVPFGSERYLDRQGVPVVVRSEVLLTGENLTDAQAGFEGDTHQPAVHLSLDGKGARIFQDVTRENINKRMAIILFEKGVGEVVTAPVIRSEITGGRVQISGSMTTTEAHDVALLLRAGSLAAPMDIVEERTIGPSLGADNIEKGIQSVIWGFVVIVAFMVVYYMLFGVFSGLALGVNLLLLMAILSLLQATLTLPGIAAMALALGMAIDANVLINERIREELRRGVSPQAAIAAGYERAWDTIFDSNITTLIAGGALLLFGSGPIKGFAVVHCIGILTSMFSSVFFSRGLVNLWYGRQRKLNKVSIGTIWQANGKI